LSWDQQFFDPIELPRRKPLITLRDAAQYIVKLPKGLRSAERVAISGPCVFFRARGRRRWSSFKVYIFLFPGLPIQVDY